MNIHAPTPTRTPTLTPLPPTTTDPKGQVDGLVNMFGDNLGDDSAKNNQALESQVFEGFFHLLCFGPVMS